MKIVYSKEEYCVACGLCEVHCKVEHSKSKDIVRAFKREHPTPIARTILEQTGPRSFSVQCRHCEDAACLKACPMGALYRDEQGCVQLREEKCVGCWMCIMVCPFGGIRRDGEKVQMAKCDLCGDRDIPACVEACPNGALVFEER